MQREAKIGVFILVAAAVFAFFIIRTNDLGSLFGDGDSKSREVRITLDDAGGIREGTAVRVFGVKVGEVQRLELEQDFAVAVITVRDDIQFKQEAHAEARTQGVLGERFLALVTGTGAPLADQTHLDGRTPASLEDLTSTFKQLSDNLVVITDRLKESTTTDSGDNRLTQIAANIERLTAVLADMVTENRANMATTAEQMARFSEGLNRDVPQLIANLTELSSSLRTMAGNNTGRVDQTMESMTALSKNMEAASASINSIAAKVDSGEGTIGRLINEGESVDKLNQLLDSANESMEEVKGLINKTVNLDIKLSFRSDYLLEHQSTKNYFGLMITPSPDKYYLIEGVSRNTDHLPIQFEETVGLTYDADGNLLTREVVRREKEPDDFLLNGLLAYRFGNFYLKGGVIESEGGGGFDWFSDSKKLHLSMAAFDFGRNDMDPNTKIDLRYQVTPNLHLNLGWDDILEKDLNSAVIGGGIRWSDEDLKVLLGLAGSLR